MPTQANLKPASLWPEDFVSGGLLNDEDVEVEDAVYTLEPPPGYNVQRGTPLFSKWSFKVLSDGRIEESFMSAGSTAGDNFVPSDDGRFAMPTSGRDQLPKNSIHFLFLQSLAGKGVPKPLLQTGDLGALKGLQFHAIREATKMQTGMTAAPAEGERERTHIVCERLIRLPGEKGKKGATRAGAPAPAPQLAAPTATPADNGSGGGEIEADTLVALKKVLLQNNKTLELKLVRAKVFRELGGMKTADRNEAVRMVTDPDWLTNQGFLVDESTVTMAD